MFGPFRRFPIRGLALVAIGFMLANAFAGESAAGFGLLLALPLLMFKMFFLFFLFGAFFRFAGGGRHGDHRGNPGHHRDRPGDTHRDAEADSDRRDWEESLRQAREEVRRFDTSEFPPRGPFTPPSDEPEKPVDASRVQDA